MRAELHAMPVAAPASDRLARVRGTSLLTGDPFARWRTARIAIIGAGALGSHFALAVVRSGAVVLAIDADRVEAHNVGTQAVPIAAVGRRKVDAVVDACDAIEPGRAFALPIDVRGVGYGVLAACDLIVDCTDAGGLARHLTSISNAAAIPLVRLAVDGTGTREMGRVLVSHGGGGHACQLCSYGVEDLVGGPPTPCPGGRADDGAEGRAPTLAGMATTLAVVGLGLLQAQRLVGGRDRERALDHETLLDLTGGVLHTLALARSARCLGDHAPITAVALASTTAEITLRGLFAKARDLLRAPDPTLTPLAAPLALAAACSCGSGVVQPACVWSTPPACPRCGRAMYWRRDALLASIGAAQAAHLRILDAPLAALGIPDGALVVARAGATRTDLLLRPAHTPFAQRGLLE